MDRRLLVVGASIILLILIYGFITVVFKHDQKKFSHDRIFVDYSDYRHTPKKPRKESSYVSVYRHPNAYRAAREAEEIKRTMFKNTMTATIVSYNTHMSEALKNKNLKAEYPKPLNNPQYNEILELSNKSIPGLQSGMLSFSNANYSRALEKFHSAMESLAPMDVKHRIDIFGMMAECYLKLGNNDGYVQNKIRQVRMERRLKSILQDTFPSKRDSMKIFDWPTTQDASKHLLRMKTLAMRTNSSRIRETVKRAELDLEVSRKVSQ